MARLEEYYKETIAPALMEELALDNAMQIPRITKITLNMGVGDAPRGAAPPPPPPPVN